MFSSNSFYAILVRISAQQPKRSIDVVRPQYALGPTVAAGRIPPLISFCFAVFSFSQKGAFAGANTVFRN